MVYLCWSATEAGAISATSGVCTGGPRKFVIVKSHERVSSVCNQNRLESISLEIRNIIKWQVGKSVGKNKKIMRQLSVGK